MVPIRTGGEHYRAKRNVGKCKKLHFSAHLPCKGETESEVEVVSTTTREDSAARQRRDLVRYVDQVVPAVVTQVSELMTLLKD